MQKKFRDYLEALGGQSIVCEEDYVDIKRDKKGIVTFYEIKPYKNPINCIRESIGQLLEYRFFESKIKPSYIVAIGKTPLDKKSKLFLQEIQKQIPEFSYQQFDAKNLKLFEKYK